ncbi:MAG: hypothetical protein ABW277_07275 [Longimicrobiaceae bacterium]
MPATRISEASWQGVFARTCDVPRTDPPNQRQVCEVPTLFS